MSRNAIPVSILSFALTAAMAAASQQDPQDAAPPVISQDRPAYNAKPADGRRSSDLPIETYAVTPGTKFLVRLEDELDTKGTRENSRFRVRTLEPLEAGAGIYLPAGAEQPHL